MTEFWEDNFAQKQEMWGMEPAQSAVRTKELFLRKGVQDILIPGMGYGRNAWLFHESGIKVTGIEIAPTAIRMAKKHYGEEMTIYQGSVTAMPFDDRVYQGIFCHGLIHLLDKEERAGLIRNCYNQLAEGGYMVFSTITKEAETYGQGTCVGKDRFEMFGGVRMFFYDERSIQEEFGSAGVVEIDEVQENYPFYLITCRK